VIQKAFHLEVVKGGREAVGEVADVVVDWILRACSGRSDSGVHDGDCGGRLVGADGNEKVCVEAEDFFKLFALEVFGKVAMGYDFRCFPSLATSDDNGNSNSNVALHNKKDVVSNGTHTYNDNACNCLQMPPDAQSFDFLNVDIGNRSTPTSLMNPCMQFYSIPTPHNKKYHHHMDRIKGLVGKIIGLQLNRLCSDGGVMEGDTNMITHLLQSTIEENFSPTDTDGNTGCPFSSSLPSKSIPDTVISNLTPTDKDQIIESVSKMLITFLMAGYETTAISMSFVVYFLSKYKRCQERCAEEARRVLGRFGVHGTDIDDDELVYCRAVFMETIRLHLPVMFTTRVTEKEMSFDTGLEEGHNVTIPKGTRCVVCPTVVHMDERNFERAEEFLPERWVRWERGRWVERDYETEGLKSTALPSITEDEQDSPPISAKYDEENNSASSISAADPHNFFSFSDGARNCVGKRLAIMESTILIAVLLRDVCVDFAEEGFEMKKVRRFVTCGPESLPVVFWRRE